MKLTYKGKYSGDEASLPTKEHPEGYQKFKEPDSKKFMLLANGIAALITVVTVVVAGCVTFGYICSDVENGSFIKIMLAFILPMITIVPHEFMHALCFKGEVYMYAYPQAGAMFVLGLEDMSKSRFVFMSLLPNLVLGFIPFILGMFFPEMYWIAFFGALNIGSGSGDYLNVFNALSQVPKGAKIYASGFHSYWYLPA